MAVEFTGWYQVNPYNISFLGEAPSLIYYDNDQLKICGYQAQIRKSMSQSCPGSPESSVQAKSQGLILSILLIDLEYLSGLCFLPLAQWPPVQWGITKKMVLLADVHLSIWPRHLLCCSDVGPAFPHHTGRKEVVDLAGFSWALSNVLGSA